MDRIVKASVVLTVQFQRDVTRKRENVLRDARLDGNSLHVMHVRHVPSYTYIHMSRPMQKRPLC